MTKSRYWLKACTLAALALPTAANAFAQNHEGQPGEVDGERTEEGAAAASVAPNLTLVKTTIGTETQFLTFAFNPVPGFAPTSLVCPSTHAAGCTVKVEVSAQISAVSWNNSADIDVDVTGPGQAVQPHNFVSVDSTTDGPLADVHTFQWMKRGIPAGSTQTVNILSQPTCKVVLLVQDSVPQQFSCISTSRLRNHGTRKSGEGRIGKSTSRSTPVVRGRWPGLR
jgi:hypothetical protein